MNETSWQAMLLKLPGDWRRSKFQLINPQNAIFCRIAVVHFLYLMSRGLPKTLDIDRLSALSGQFGEAALDPSLWPTFLDKISTAVGSAGAALLRGQGDVGVAETPVSPGALEVLKTYFEASFHLRDTRAIRAVPLIKAGKSVIIDQDLFQSEREMLRDPMYAALGRIGFRWFSVVGFQAGSSVWGLTIQRTIKEGAFEESHRQALAMLSGRLTEAATLSMMISRAAATGMVQGLNLINRPAVGLDRSGYVVDVNESADHLFNDEICIKNRRLYVTDALARAAFDNAFRQIRVAEDCQPINIAPITVKRRSKPPIVAIIFSIPAAVRSPFFGARTIVLLSDTGNSLNPNRDLLSQMFMLTPAETRIALLIAKGFAPETISETLKVSDETVRNQIKSVLRKTGTHRQAELVSLLARLPASSQ